MISRSTPFSLDTASATSKTFLFIAATCPMPSYFGIQPRFRHIRNRKAEYSAVDLQFNRFIGCVADHALQTAPALHWVLQRDLSRLADKAGQMSKSHQNPIQTGCRYIHPTVVRSQDASCLHRLLNV